jgi:hypothetical protein
MVRAQIDAANVVVQGAIKAAQAVVEALGTWIAVPVRARSVQKIPSKTVLQSSCAICPGASP